MLRRIAHKHASLGIRPEQYPVVHEHLFAAIAEVLGEAVTEEVAAAWTEVYWLMANALIDIERTLYARSEESALREWTVVERIDETADVATFRLRPADGGPVPPYRAGQYVSVGVRLADGARQIRQYSLTAAPGSPVRQFAVKRVPGDAATPEGEVSNHLHAHVRAGDVLELSAPYGDLVLEDTDAPLLLASAGIGVTPMIAMLEQLSLEEHTGRVTVVHADRSPAAHALRGTTRRTRRSWRTGRPCSSTRRTRRGRGDPDWSTSTRSRWPRERSPTCAGRCRSCGWCGSSCWPGGSRRPTSTTRCSGPTCGSPRTRRPDTPRYAHEPAPLRGVRAPLYVGLGAPTPGRPRRRGPVGDPIMSCTVSGSREA